VISARGHYIAVAKSASRTGLSGDVATQLRIAGILSAASRAAAPSGTNWINQKPACHRCAMKRFPGRK
jgi:hypothetical protein